MEGRRVELDCPLLYLIKNRHFEPLDQRRQYILVLSLGCSTDFGSAVEQFRAWGKNNRLEHATRRAKKQTHSYTYIQKMQKKKDFCDLVSSSFNCSTNRHPGKLSFVDCSTTSKHFSFSRNSTSLSILVISRIKPGIQEPKPQQPWDPQAKTELQKKRLLYNHSCITRNPKTPSTNSTDPDSSFNTGRNPM